MGNFAPNFFGGGSGGGNAVVDGAIVGPLVIGDDYTTGNGRGFVVDVPLPGGVQEGDEFLFTGRHRYRCDMTWETTGAVVVPSAGVARMPAELPGSASEGLEPGEYLYTLSITDSNGSVITPAASLDVPVQLIRGRLGPHECQC